MRPRRRIGEAALQICADLVRHLDASNRSYSQAVIAQLISLVPPQSPDGAAEAVDLLARALSHILDELSPRQRAILDRCDVRGENATVAANSLNISRRQLYRERRTALAWIAERLMVRSQTPRAYTITSKTDPCSERLALSQALENGGHWRPAADVLERLAEELEDPCQRGGVEIELAYLYLRADRLTMARDRAEIAKKLAGRAPAGREWREAEADVAAAGIAMAAWDIRTATHLAHRSALQLESWASGTGEARVHNALANALLVKSAVVMGQGAIDSARILANQARDITEGNERLDRRIQIDAKTHVAVLDIFTGRGIHEAEQQLRECYREALQFGFTNQALCVASNLAGTYRLQGRPRDAIDLLSTLAETTELSAWQDRARALYEFSNACIEAGDLPTAEIKVKELTEMVVGNAARQGPAQLTVARFHSAIGAWEPALIAAEAAETNFVQLGLDRLVGEALMLQIQALSGLGTFTRAARVAKAAIGLIEGSNVSFRLAAAYRIMGQIPGYSKYAMLARRLLRNEFKESRRTPTALR